MKIRFMILALSAFACGTQAQSNLDLVLASVSRNNKTLKAHTQYWEAQKASYKTGLNPADPVVGFDYMVGSPAAAGNQADLTVTQALDFPTVYVKKQQLSEQQGRQAQWQVEAERRAVLLQAKQACLDLVYHNKLQAQLVRRSARTAGLRDDFQAKMAKGEGNILDLNKARLQLADLQMKIEENQSAIVVLEARLAALNGGEALAFQDTLYPALPEVGTFDTMEKEAEAIDPARILLEQQVSIGEHELAVSKALKLPRLEVGYHYQSILGQTYNGLHTGISVPLWEHRNTTQARQAVVEAAGMELQDHVNTHFHETKELHSKFRNLGAALDTYRELLGGLDTDALLAKALALGQISAITYFMEQSYYHDAHDKLLALEWEYQKVAAELLQHRL